MNFNQLMLGQSTMTKEKNKYYRRSHISENKFRQLLKCFALDLNAYETHQLTHIFHRSCKGYLRKIASPYGGVFHGKSCGCRYFRIR